MTSVSPTSPAGLQAPPSRKTLRKVAFALPGTAGRLLLPRNPATAL